MNFDIPARVVWTANLTGEGIRSINSASIIDNYNYTNNVDSQYEDVRSVFNESLTGDSSFSTYPNYSITDSEMQDGRSTFNFSFSTYSGPAFSNTVLLGANYINNNTAYDLELIVNSGNADFTSAFNFSPTFPSGTFSDSNTIIIPAAAKNFPVVLWCNINAPSLSAVFRCELTINGLPSSTIQIEDNIARWNLPS